MINVCRFWTKEGTVVILWPETEEQQEQTLWFGHMWKTNHLENCGMDYAVEFAKEHKIKYSYLMVVDSLTG